ncbi:MAG: CBS domain-containing protein [Armatimonadetes bacterium]|nr:CBS domain-containing protein [Armatimonadota bacterium]
MPNPTTINVAYVSELLNRPVYGRGGELIGTVRDLIVRPGREPFPPVTGLVVRVSARNAVFVPAEMVQTITPQRITLGSSRLDLRPFQRREREMLLNKDVMDKQIVNIEGLKVVRVNDLQLQQVGNRWRLAGVDISAAALLARLGFRKRVLRRSQEEAEPGEVIPWENIEFFASEVPVPIRLRHEGIRRLHPTDIARLLEELSPAQGSELVASMPDELAADTLEEMDEETRQEILEQMDEERKADIIEEMEDDAATDVLQEMEPEEAERVLEEMDVEEAEAVRRLLDYGEDTAGGLMTTERITMPPTAAVEEALTMLRTHPDLPPGLYYVYVTDPEDDSSLLGTVSLRNLILSPPNAALKSIMETRLVTARVDESALEVARRISEYNLLALPILDEEDRFLGIVSVDDAIDLLLPDTERQRDRIFH